MSLHRRNGTRRDRPPSGLERDRGQSATTPRQACPTAPIDDRIRSKRRILWTRSSVRWNVGRDAHLVLDVWEGTAAWPSDSRCFWRHICAALSQLLAADRPDLPQLRHKAAWRG